MHRAATGIDIHSIRLIADHFDLCPEFAQYRWCDLIGCTIGAIDHYLDPLKVQFLWETPLDELNVSPLGIVDSIGFPDGIGRWPEVGYSIRDDEIFNASLHLIGKFEPVVGKKFYPVILVGIV